MMLMPKSYHDEHGAYKRSRLLGLFLYFLTAATRKMRERHSLFRATRRQPPRFRSGHRWRGSMAGATGKRWNARVIPRDDVPEALMKILVLIEPVKDNGFRASGLGRARPSQLQRAKACRPTAPSILPVADPPQ
jgi:hypothetical protein